MPDINAGLPKSFEAGGKLLITDGATVYTVLNIVPGSLVFQNAGYATLPFEEDIDRGVLPTTARQGAQTPGSVECTATVTAGSFAAAELQKIIDAAHASGVAKAYTATLQSPDYRGATGGGEVVCANAVFMERFGMRQSGNRLETPVKLTFPHAATITEEATL